MIAAYIARDSPGRAISFVREIRARFREVGGRPLLFQLRPEIGDGARLAVVGHYAILFRVVGEVVRIERVVHGGRELARLFGGEV